MKYKYICENCGCTDFEKGKDGMWCVECGQYYSYYEALDIMRIYEIPEQEEQ